MNELDQDRQRFLQDSPDKRLGAVAANLSRIRSCTDVGRDVQAALGMIKECRRYIAWTLADWDASTQSCLRQLDQELSAWLERKHATWQDPLMLQEVAHSAGTWCDKVLELSGAWSIIR